MQLNVNVVVEVCHFGQFTSWRIKITLRKRLEIKGVSREKATAVISVAGTITTLIFAFVTFATSTIHIETPFYIQGIIIASIIASIFAIVKSIQALALKNYGYVMDIERLSQEIIKGQENGILKLNQYVISGYKNDKDIEDDVISRYLKTISKNAELNIQKGKSVTGAIYSLITSITLIGIAVVLTLLQSLFNWHDSIAVATWLLYFFVNVYMI